MNKQPALLIDLDGTIYKGNRIIEGAVDFIHRLDQAGIHYLFVTNRGNRTAQVITNSLISMGLNCRVEHILTSAMATADYLKNEKTAYWIGEQGLSQAMENAGIEFDDINPDVVIAGYDRKFNYQKLTIATRLILNGSKFIATNDDHIISVEDGILPEAGPIVAAIQKATAIEPLIIGKPHSAMIHSACERLNVEPGQCIIIGDNLSTDILTGVKHGLLSALVLTGVTQAQDLQVSEIKPTWVVNNLHEFGDALFDTTLNGLRKSDA